VDDEAPFIGVLGVGLLVILLVGFEGSCRVCGAPCHLCHDAPIGAVVGELALTEGDMFR
jgi:hypothetical protein